MRAISLIKDGGFTYMVTVTLTDKMSLDKALRKFKKELDKDNTLSEYMEHSRFVKPSAKKHQKAVHAKHIQKKIAEAEKRESFLSEKQKMKKENKQ